ncbi:MAG TPA: DUF3341 domain-containing protein [Acidobacteriota bacterium]|nr:DUF3341 domain-containing protein [Acidobacteriota bacterium]
MQAKTQQTELFGLMAEFKDAESIIAAAEKVRRQGYRKVEGYSPMPVEELDHALGHSKSHVPKLVFLGGLLGCATGIGMQYWISAVDYPLNVGGRPLASWVSFIPVTFELTILFAAFAAVIGMIALNGLPSPYHPVFNVRRFQYASRDRFFLVVESADARFDRVETRRFLETLNPTGVHDVEP